MHRKLNEHRVELEQFGVKTLAYFGSIARDEARPDSDVDILVEFGEPVTFRRFMRLKFWLEDLLHCRVDLVTRAALKPRLRPSIEREAIYVTGLATVSG